MSGTLIDERRGALATTEATRVKEVEAALWKQVTDIGMRRHASANRTRERLRELARAKDDALDDMDDMDEHEPLQLEEISTERQELRQRQGGLDALMKRPHWLDATRDELTRARASSAEMDATLKGAIGRAREAAGAEATAKGSRERTLAKVADLEADLGATHATRSRRPIQAP